MEEQELLQEEQESTNQVYIDAINNLKSNSVSREQYDKIVEENRNLVNSLVNGNYASTDEVEVEKKDLMTLRKELFTPEHELTDLEYVTKALELRERVLEETGEDCFVAKAHGYQPGADAYASAQRCADVYKECIEAANGSNSRFIAELQERTKEVLIPRRK